ncbi:MAG: YdcF family protein [Pyrinomonadaceae bacterium]
MREGNFTQRRKGAKKSAWRYLCAALLLLAAWSLIAWGAARALFVDEELAHADALVVLSGSGAYVERTRLAAKLWKEGRAPQVVLTNDNQRGGWSEAEQRNPFFVERAFQELRRAGVPEDKIVVLPEEVMGTYDEVLSLRRYAGAKNLRSILVVTSGYHSRRALWTMRKVFQGSEVAIGLKAIESGEQSPPPATWWLHIEGWRMVALEYVKLIYYRVEYR